MIAVECRRRPNPTDDFIAMWAKWLFLRWWLEREQAQGREGSPAARTSEWQPRHDSVPTGRCTSPVHAMYPPHDIASHAR